MSELTTTVQTAIPVSANQSGIDLKVETRPICMADLDFSTAPTVRGIGYRFIIPVPNLGAENTTLEIKNWKGEAEAVVGYGFKNATDQALQAVVGDGTGVIVVALNPEAGDIHGASKAIMSFIGDLGGPESLTVSKLNRLMDFVHNTLGLVDTYNSNDKTASAMAPQAGFIWPGDRPFGLFEKMEKAGPRALFVKGNCTVVDGPHAGTATYPDGFMAVQLPPKKEGQAPSYRSIAPGAIDYCYEFEDGRSILDNIEVLPTVHIH